MTRSEDRDRSRIEGTAEAWQATWASLAMILLVFFVMLVSYAQVSARSALSIREAVQAKAAPAASAPGGPVAALREEDGEGTHGEAALVEAGGILRVAVAQANLSREGVLERTRAGWNLTLDADALFEPGGSTVRASMEPLLRAVGRAAHPDGLAVRVEASAPAALRDGARPSWAEPALRAAAVVAFLERDGVRSPLSLRSRATGPGDRIVISVIARRGES